jgi:Mg-chelatase subunit ChlD
VGGLVDPAELVVRDWAKPGTGLCLLVDRSGSMTGRPLATAAVAAAAIAARAGADYSVVAFAADAVVAKSQDVPKPTESVVTGVLTLRGFGTTNLALALQTAAAQLERSSAGRRITVLLSDCRATVPGDAHGPAAALEELVILAPEGDSAEAEAFAAATGARWGTVGGPTDVPAALERLL